MHRPTALALALALVILAAAASASAQDAGLAQPGSVPPRPAGGLDGPYDPANPFARILRGEIPASTVLETDQLIVILPLSSMSRGHVLVIPKCACRTLADVPADRLSAVMTTLQTLMAAERLAYDPAGFNVRQNNGREAGQTVFHVHFHLIPRYANTPLQLDETITQSRAAMEATALDLRTALARLSQP